MDRNTVIGIILIFGLLFVWAQLNQPTQEELEEQQRIKDSIENAQTLADQPTVDQPATEDTATFDQTSLEELPDSLKQQQLQGKYGPFSGSAEGTETIYTLENNLIKIDFSSKGGWVKEATLKEYYKILTDEENKDYKVPLKLLEDEKNIFEYKIPVNGVPGGVISTSNLYFTAQKNENTLTLRANAGEGRYIEQKYSLSPDSYQLDYDVNFVGMDGIIPNSTNVITLNWVNYLDKLEKNTAYERTYSTAYFKPTTDGVDYCSCRQSDEEEIDQNVKWISHANQFFNTSIIADQFFGPSFVESIMLEEEDDDLKKLTSNINIPIDKVAGADIGMQLYIGPNEFKRLAAFDQSLEDIIPFGWSIFGTINRWIIRPLFNFLSSAIGSAGLVILILTLIVKLALYPLTYRMLYSQSKMAALKPEITKVKENIGDDQQKQQMETMKLYREFGVNPLGGCFPVVLQMPIWFALYRFFPASIEFRQAGFLWATDLSSYDEFIRLAFEIPFYGSHVSLFTLLWAGTTLIYTYFNSQQMDMSGNPMMKYMQYFMPVMFLFFFNNFASGLTCYLFFSNVFNITQTLVTKNYIIDKKKIKAELEAYRKKPKKKGGFQDRLAKALKEQQRIQAEREAAKKKKK